MFFAGCFHNGTLFADGSLVPTTEPCLSCKCNGRTLICSLRICPEMPVPPPRGCVLVQKKNSCCSYLSCTKYHTLYNGPNRRIIAYLDHFERETLDRMVSENVLFRRSDDSDIDGSGEICIHNGTVYKSGSAMSSSSLCSYCYCIGGIQKCVKPKCMLSMDGCKPIFVDSTCCPVRYDCSSKSSGIMKSQNHIRRVDNKHYQRIAQRLQRGRGCIVDSEFYTEGQKMPTDMDKLCDICFCIRGSRKCAPKKCAPALRNCIPVVPKGQCCPSSYDCGIFRDPHRGYLPRQFDLFSLLFGTEEGENVTSNVSLENTQQSSPTSEKGILDAIREGLEFIDNNEGSVVNVLEDLNYKENFPAKNTTLDHLSEENYKLNIYDEQPNILRKDSTPLNSTEAKIPSPEQVATKIYAEEDNTNVNLFIGLLTEYDLNSSTVTIKDDENTTSGIPDIDYITLSENENSYDDVSEHDDVGELSDYSTEGVDVNISEEDNHNSNWNLATTDSILNASSDVDNIKFDPVTITAHPVVEKNKPTFNLESEDIKVVSIRNDPEINTTQSSIEQSISIALSTYDITPDSRNAETMKKNEIVSSTMPNKKEEMQSVGEQSENFLSALFNGLSTIFKEEGNETEPILSNVTTTTENIVIIDTKSTGNLSTTLKDSLVKSESNYEENASATPVNAATISSIQKKSFSIITTESPIIIKTNPSILESDFSLDYNNPMLPPSLPNLKIIPFLPTDAVKNDRKQTGYDFYNIQSTPFPLITGNPEAWPINTATKNLESKLDYERYPSITEKYGSTPYSDNYVPYENSKKFAYDDYEYSEFDVANRHSDKYVEEYVHNKYNTPIKKFDTMLINAEKNQQVGVIEADLPGFNFDHQVSRFSPPTKTEGGFVPKNPIRDTDFYYENYHTTKLFVELTTANPKINVNSSKLGIPTQNPFKDVIKTEAPPDLHLLIEDKEKLLANGVTATLYEPAIGVDTEQFGKEISITTDSSYNYKSEYKDANDIINESSPSSSINNISKITQVAPVIGKTTPQINDNGNLTLNDAMEKTVSINEEFKYKKQLKDIRGSNSTNNSKMEVVKNRTNNKILVHDKIIQRTEDVNEINIKELNVNKSESIKYLSNPKNILAATFSNDPTIGPFVVIQNNNNNAQPSKLSSTTIYPILSEPFNKLPFLNPSFPVKPQVVKTEALNSDPTLYNLNSHTYSSHKYSNPSGYEILPNDSTTLHGINPMNIDDLSQHQSEGPTQVFTKPHTASSLRDPGGILKLAGCNIYGRMYRVGRIISELSGPCLECKCTEIGVNCTQLEC